ncbi:thiol:disulfide interchange protein TlpA [Methylovirgula sp. 4M-Z18]|uniref:thiol:disulfide interchange protein TlpA n=1 Tax=Methylovirgula sp. 4M-Z18 TaxID=2293567 RepID=UPI001FDEAC4E|nr:TlpA disulfide reductase family protein [Methylovirgula sp. 4M-Z18]
MTGPQNSSPAPKSRLPVLIGAIAVILALGLSLYWKMGSGGKEGAENTAAANCPAAKALSERLAPLMQGEVAGVMAERAPQPAPDLHFTGPDGKALTMADFRGRAVLLNLWATWCIPCRKEMPALDALQAAAGDGNFEVVAVNTDTSRLERRQQFLEQAGIQHLAFYADPEGGSFQKMKSIGKGFGLPTSLLIDKSGCMVASIEGPAEWASEDAQRLVAELKK